MSFFSGYHHTNCAPKELMWRVSLFVCFLLFLGWGRKLLKCWTSEPETLPDDWQEVPAMKKWISSQQNAVKSHKRRPPEESEREECWCDLLEPGTRETLKQTYWPIFHFSSFHISTVFFYRHISHSIHRNGTKRARWKLVVDEWDDLDAC